MATNPALTARTTLVAEELRKAVLRRTLQAVAGALDRLLPPQPLNRELELPLSGSNILLSERRMFLGISGARAVSPAKQTPCTVLDWFRAIQPSRADYYCPKRDARNASRGRPRSAEERTRSRGREHLSRSARFDGVTGGSA